MKRRSIFLPLLRLGLIALALFVFDSCAKDDGKRASQLVVAMELNYPPFEMKNTQGQPVGVSVDLAKDLGAYLGKEVVIKDIAWDGIIPSLQSGRVDCIISSMTITEERRQNVEFSDPYLETRICLLVRKGSGLKTLEELDKPGKRIAVKLDTTGYHVAKERLKQARVDVFTDAVSCAEEVHNGRADAFLYDQVSIVQMWNKFPDTTEAVLDPVRVERWGVAIRKEDTALRDSINAFIKEYRAKGGFEKLADTWMKEQKTAFKEMGVEFEF